VETVEMEAEIRQLRGLVEAQLRRLQKLLELRGQPGTERRADALPSVRRKRTSRKGLLKL
jgi:hypothetical protein